MLTKTELETALQLDRHHLPPLLPLFEIEREIYYTVTTWEVCEDQWNVFKRLSDKTGYWPVILGDAQDLEYIREHHEIGDDLSPEHILEAAEKLDAAQWFRDQYDPQAELDRQKEELRYMESLSNAPKGGWDSMIELYKKKIADLEAEIARGGKLSEPPMEWPEAHEISQHASLTCLLTPRQWEFCTDTSRRGEAQVMHLAFVPTVHSWQVPAYFSFGAFNGCPHPEVHVSILKFWNSIYHSELAVISHDMLELTVDDPPLSRESAWKLAGEQQSYAEFDQAGILDQRKHLAQALLGASYWYFWWD